MQRERFVTVLALAGAMAALAASNDQPLSNKKDEAEASAIPSEALVGIGAAIKPPPPKDGKQMIEQGAEIFKLLPNSPAALCGELAVGDLIVAIAQGDDEPIDCHGMEFGEVINLIRGPEGTEVRLTVIPADHRFVKRKVIALRREPLQGGKLVGKKAPDVILTGLTDGREKKMSDFSRKIVVLEFWMTTCAPCIVSVNAMHAYPEQHPAWGDHVALMTLSLDERKETAEDFLRKMDWRVTHNFWGSEKVKRAFDADLLPLVVVIDADGTIAAAGHPGVVNVPKVVDGLLSR